MFIYLITNKINGKQYVGQHSGNNLQRYWNKHVNRALSNTSDSVRALYGAVQKYGPESFEIEPLILLKIKEQLDVYEKVFIQALNTKAPNGYNLTDGGDGVFNPSQETRLKMSQAQLGKRQSEETKLKRAEKLRGQKRTEETKKKMSDALLGNQNCLGRFESEETRRKKSVAHKGNKYAQGAFRSEEYRKKLSDIFKGRKFSDETRKKMSIAAKNRRIREASDGLVNKPGIQRTQGSL
jgi:group I intron endonuclease